MGSSTFRKAATLDELLYTCIGMFDEKGDLNDNNLLPRNVLLMHRWYWIVEFPAEFNLDLGLIQMTEEFRELASQLGYEEHINLIDISSM
ncbi:unnamed protein product [Ranitomeya imitator]|uniref:Uncharacterized protein n=1 Tax=Ranitomeya imitator TaxID=111125 RepID=A0ABN9LUI8_9NEOB|nr:unnamed protein product [Ranitomeya imitator]